MKQTAAEWLFLQMENLITKAKVTDMDNNDFVISKVKLLQQSKEMEKEQHEETFNQSRLAKIFEKDMPPVWESWEQYYNETFNN
jgi:hypothetical protein